MAARNRLYRTPGTGSVRQHRSKYEARTAQSREHPHGERIGVYDTRFRANQAADAWFARFKQERNGT